MRLGVVTCRRLPEPQADDALMLDALDDVEVVAAPWDVESAPWQSCAAVLIRSPWDYHERVDEFVAWAARLEAAGTTLWNPASLVGWNARKTYLRELEAAGIATVPTLWLEGGEPGEWAREIERTGWSDLVLKPIVGASSFLTWRMAAADLARRQDRLERLAAHGGALVQPFVREIVTEGRVVADLLRGALQSRGSQTGAGGGVPRADRVRRQRDSRTAS